MGRPEIQKFVGALHGRRSRKGIFLTTSTFTKDAREYAEGLETKVILIDGVQLAELMFEYGVGVQTESTYVVKRMDSDFFEDEGGTDMAAAAAVKVAQVIAASPSAWQCESDGQSRMPLLCRGGSIFRLW